MNMKDYCRVVDRVHADAKCKEAILSDAVMASGQKLPARRPVLGGFSLYVTGAAACLMLLFCGAFFWKLTADSDEFVQMSTPEVIEVSGDSEPEEAAVPTTDVQTTTAQTTSTAEETEAIAQSTSAVTTTTTAQPSTTSAAQTSTTSAARAQTTTVTTVSDLTETELTEETTETTQAALSVSEEEQEFIAMLQALVEPYRTELYQEHAGTDGSFSIPWMIYQIGNERYWEYQNATTKIERPILFNDIKMVREEDVDFRLEWLSADALHYPRRLPDDIDLHFGKLVLLWDPAEIPDGCYNKPITFIVLHEDGRLDYYML